jgi:hypothetical protein
VQEVKEQHIQQSKNLPNNQTVPSLCFKNHGQQKNKPPPDHPDFTIFSPSTKNHKCATYIHISACLQSYIHFQYSNFAIAITIQPIDHPSITILTRKSLKKQLRKAVWIYLHLLRKRKHSEPVQIFIVLLK